MGQVRSSAIERSRQAVGSAQSITDYRCFRCGAQGPEGLFWNGPHGAWLCGPCQRLDRHKDPMTAYWAEEGGRGYGLKPALNPRRFKNLYVRRVA